MRFEGRVYDGPWEGRQYAIDRLYFEISIAPPFSWRAPFPPIDMPALVEIRRGYYRWSSPLRAWVFCWDGNPSRYAFEVYRREYA